MSTFILRLDGSTGGSGLRLAVKDLVDMEGLPTTAGCRAVAAAAVPAERDAACMAGARAAEAEGRVRIVGKTNLHELAFGASGVNPWYGTPVNPLDPARIPGGSSSGSAVAVAAGEADVAFGSDTGGSVRIPSACCGTTGLKTTWGRVPLDGVWLVSHSLDTIGPMARDVAGVVAGMALLEPGFGPDPIGPTVVGRVRLPTEPAIDTAIDRALAAAELEVVDVELPGWDAAAGAAATILMAEAWAVDGDLLERDPGGVGGDVAEMVRMGRSFTAEQVATARTAQGAWQAELRAVFDRVQVLAMPTLQRWPPLLERAGDVVGLVHTLPVNVAGVPAIALPVAGGGPLPPSLQLVGPAYGEEQLVALARVVEAAAGGARP